MATAVASPSIGLTNSLNSESTNLLTVGSEIVVSGNIFKTNYLQDYKYALRQVSQALVHHHPDLLLWLYQGKLLAPK